MPRTLLVAGHGPGLRRALARAGGLGLRTVALIPERDGNARADAVVVSDPRDGDAVASTAREHGVAGILPASAEAVVAVDEAVRALGLGGIVLPTDGALAGRIALRRRLGEHGVAQSRFAAVRSVHEGHAALATVGIPAVLRPAETWIVDLGFPLGGVDDLDACLHRVLAASPSSEAIVEAQGEGDELEALVAAAASAGGPLLLADRPSPDTRVSPSALYGDALLAASRSALHAVRALGLAEALATVRVAVAGTRAEVVDVAVWTPAVPLDALARHAVGVDPLELAIRLAVGVDLPAAFLEARFQRPAALRLHASGATVAGDGVAEAGEGYVVTSGATNVAARLRAEAVA